MINQGVISYKVCRSLSQEVKYSILNADEMCHTSVLPANSLITHTHVLVYTVDVLYVKGENCLQGAVGAVNA